MPTTSDQETNQSGIIYATTFVRHRARDGAGIPVANNQSTSGTLQTWIASVHNASAMQ